MPSTNLVSLVIVGDVHDNLFSIFLILFGNMQQPTPAPTDYPGSSPPPGEAATPEDGPVEYPVPPQNDGSAPFYVLSALFDRLQNERKPDKRRRLLATWFNVRTVALGAEIKYSSHSLALARGEGIRFIPRLETHIASGMIVSYPKLVRC